MVLSIFALVVISVLATRPSVITGALIPIAVPRPVPGAIGSVSRAIGALDFANAKNVDRERLVRRLLV